MGKQGIASLLLILIIFLIAGLVIGGMAIFVRQNQTRIASNTVNEPEHFNPADTAKEEDVEEPAAAASPQALMTESPTAIPTVAPTQQPTPAPTDSKPVATMTRQSADSETRSQFKNICQEALSRPVSWQEGVKFEASYCQGDQCRGHSEEDCEDLDMVKIQEEQIVMGEDGLVDCHWVISGSSAYCAALNQQ